MCRKPKVTILTDKGSRCVNIFDIPALFARMIEIHYVKYKAPYSLYYCKYTYISTFKI